MHIEDDDDNVDIEAEVPTSYGGEAKFAAVETKSGEENFNALCSLKCKLMRFDEGENQWKERGQGEVKILCDKNNTKKHMLLVRREVIGKIAAQHPLGPGMTLKAVPTSAMAVIWSTKADYSDDEEGIPETFLAKFPTQDAAEQFKSLFTTVTGK